MLALTRKCGERIVIGDNITVTVVDVKGDSVRLAIDAPRDVKVWRGELYDAIAAENKAAAVNYLAIGFAGFDADGDEGQGE